MVLAAPSEALAGASEAMGVRLHGRAWARAASSTSALDKVKMQVEVGGVGVA